jgi:glutamyl-Q tRNA(Asp) synthetase
MSINEKPLKKTYIGRFAPTPSGPLHLGSLFTALASYLDAKHHQGSWQVRIEDLDVPRCQPGAAADILRTLEKFGLLWDGPVFYQSTRSDIYQETLRAFGARGNRLYPCICTRRQRQKLGSEPYPGTCRHRALNSNTLTSSTPNKSDANHTLQPAAIRWQMRQDSVQFTDRVMGPQLCQPSIIFGDPVLVRKDSFFAYHWAVVVDDELQSITDIVRGQDLLTQTAIHLALQKAANYNRPRYAHVPLILGADGCKLSKSARARSLATAEPSQLLCRMLVALGQLPEASVPDRTNSPVTEILLDAALHWDIAQIPKTTSLPAQFLIG